MADFRKLVVWEKSQAFSLDAFRVVRRIRGAIHASLRDQLVRSSESVPTNIVEGVAARGPREFARFVGYAIASLCEFEHHLLTARGRGILSEADFHRLHEQLVEVRKMLHGLLRSLRRAAEKKKPQ